MAKARNDSSDRHAADREHKRRKARYGMRVTGTSVRVLRDAIAREKPQRRQRKRT